MKVLSSALVGRVQEGRFQIADPRDVRVEDAFFRGQQLDEAIRQLKQELGRNDTFYVHVTLVPYMGPAEELIEAQEVDGET